MKNLLVFLSVVAYLFLSSCATSTLAVQEKEDAFEPFSLGIVENFNLTPAMMEKMQFFSGSDTIVLQKSIKVATGSVASDGTLLLTGGEPTKKVFILPHTPGTIAPKGVILGNDKKVKEVLVSFSDNEKNALSFMPTNDEFGTFSLSESDGNGNVKNPEGKVLMIKLFYMEQQDQSKIEPGRLVGQKKTTEKTKSTPDKKFVRND